MMEQENKTNETTTGVAAMGLGLSALGLSIRKPPFLCKLDVKMWVLDCLNVQYATYGCQIYDFDELINMLRPKYDKLPDFFDLDAKIKTFVDSIAAISKKENNGEKGDSI